MNDDANKLNVGDGAIMPEDFRLQEEITQIRERVVTMLAKLDKNLASKVALGWGLTVQEPEK